MHGKRGDDAARGDARTHLRSGPKERRARNTVLARGLLSFVPNLGGCGCERSSLSS